MEWTILLTPEFLTWFVDLPAGTQDRINVGLRLIREFGPTLGRPHVDTFKNSRVANMKELRVQVGGTPIRVFFAFDPILQAVILCGGDKTGDKRFYKRMIPLAEAIMQRHNQELEPDHEE